MDVKIEVINTRYPDGLPNGTIMTVTYEYDNGTVAATVDGGNGFEWYLHAGMYRIKPEPKRDVETVCWHKSWGFLPRRHREATHRITFDTIDGEPDLNSIKMECIG